MGQAAVGSDSVCDSQKGYSEPHGNEAILYRCRHFSEVKSENLLMARTIDRATCGPGSQKEP